jgi:predicted MPP superfamily phosphohydrolase
LHFRLIVTLLAFGTNFGLAALEIHLLRRRRPWPRSLGVAVLAWAALMSALGVLQVYSPKAWRPFLHDWLYLPLSVEMVWNLFVTLIFLGAIVLTLALGRARKINPSAAPLSEHEISRRKFIYLVACGAAPATAVALGVHGTLTRNDLRVRDFDIAVPNLPPEFEGFTIAHVSDLHSGLFCGPERLRKISDATNDLRADLVVITGDVINTSMSEFPPALEVIRRMKSRLGTYLCEGNHDLIPGPGVFRRACAASGLPLLWNSSVILPMNDKRLIIGGLPFYRSGYAGHTEIVDGLYPERRAGDVRLLLSHHPDLYDIAGSADLVLTGHTHGGQIMVGPVGFGPLFFKYWSGLYRRGGNSMVVSNGAGDWFPCRIGAPAEIGRLRLVRAS